MYGSGITNIRYNKSTTDSGTSSVQATVSLCETGWERELGVATLIKPRITITTLTLVAARFVYQVSEGSGGTWVDAVFLGPCGKHESDGWDTATLITLPEFTPPPGRGRVAMVYTPGGAFTYDIELDLLVLGREITTSKVVTPQPDINATGITRPLS